MNSCKQARLLSNQSLWATIGSASGHIDGPLNRTRAHLKFEFRSSRLIRTIDGQGLRVFAWHVRDTVTAGAQDMLLQAAVNHLMKF
jgi:hypothetical protein